jgi:hypothetical protein
VVCQPCGHDRGPFLPFLGRCKSKAVMIPAEVVGTPDPIHPGGQHRCEQWRVLGAPGVQGRCERMRMLPLSHSALCQDKLVMTELFLWVQWQSP